MIFVKSILVGALALVISAALWVAAAILPSEQSVPPSQAPSEPPYVADSQTVAGPPVATFDLRSTWTTTPAWLVFGIAALIFGLGFYWEFRRLRAPVNIIQTFKEHHS